MLGRRLVGRGDRRENRKKTPKIMDKSEDAALPLNLVFTRQPDRAWARTKDFFWLAYSSQPPIDSNARIMLRMLPEMEARGAQA